MTMAADTAPVRPLGPAWLQKVAPLAGIGVAAILVSASSTFAVVQDRAASPASQSLSAARAEQGTAASRSAAQSPVVPRPSDGRNGAPLALISGEPMFPLASSGTLESWKIDAPVEAHDVKVQSVSATGFWMGSDQVQRVYVSIPASAVQRNSLALKDLQVGETVNVSGRVSGLPDNVKALLLDADSKNQLNIQQKLIVANNVRVPT